MSIMDQVKKNLREWYALAADRTGDMAKISVRMYDKYGISREIERQLSELGSYVYHAVDEDRTDFAGDEEFMTAIGRVRALEQDLEAKVAEIEEIRIQRQQRQSAREEAQAAADAEAAAQAEATVADQPTEDSEAVAVAAEPSPEPADTDRRIDDDGAAEVEEFEPESGDAPDDEEPRQDTPRP
jgi:hypothetical protein